jgi:hypothetical protein
MGIMQSFKLHGPLHKVKNFTEQSLQSRSIFLPKSELTSSN